MLLRYRDMIGVGGLHEIRSTSLFQIGSDVCHNMSHFWEKGSGVCLGSAD
jgi:hypothetical protein